MTTRPIRIANCSGFLGDRLSAAREMVEGGPIDVLTGDYLAELTMAILMRQRMHDPAAGYARTFLAQMEAVLGTCLDRGIKVVANAGGLNAPGLAEALDDLAATLGLRVSVATVTGDDLMPELDSLAEGMVHLDTGERLADAGLQPVTASAYLGGWGITAALDRGADVVVTGRVSDASLVTGPAAWHFGWARDDWDRLAGAVVAGHIIECGAQATGGNYSFFAEVPDMRKPGFPIAEIHEDGSSLITKHPGTGGLVSAGTVTAQLLYEIGPTAYLNPDVVAHFDTIELIDEDGDRVRVQGVRGTPPPRTTKVAAVAMAGFRNTMTVVLTGLDIEAKADAVLAALWEATGGPDVYDAVETRLIRTEHTDATSSEQAMAYLVVTVDDRDPAKVGRAFSNAVVELVLASVPGFTITSPPGKESPLVRYWPALVPQRASVVSIGSERIDVPSDGPFAEDGAAASSPSVATAAHAMPGRSTDTTPVTVASPIGRIIGARSGDKGGHANLGVWARTPEAFDWLRGFLTPERLTELLPDTAGLQIDRYELPNLFALNFVIRGFLGEGVASSTKWDPQAKTLGEYFRSRVVDIPEPLLAV